MLCGTTPFFPQQKPIGSQRFITTAEERTYEGTEHGVDEILKIHDSSTRENIHLVSGMKAWGLVIMLSIIWGGLFFFVEMVAK